jgi:predicted dehydrogenase
MPESTGPPSLRIAIVGVGGVARYAHLPAYRQRGLRVTALCDIDGDLAHEVAAEFQVETATDDARKLAERGDVDVVDIATPPAAHPELIEIFAAAGKPMLVQKPLCVNQDEFDRIAQVVAVHNPWIRLNLTGRHVSAWQKVAALLAAGKIGRPFLCTILNRDWWDREPGPPRAPTGA